jgi:hypothetical protein
MDELDSKSQIKASEEIETGGGYNRSDPSIIKFELMVEDCLKKGENAKNIFKELVVVHRLNEKTAKMIVENAKSKLINEKAGGFLMKEESEEEWKKTQVREFFTGGALMIVGLLLAGFGFALGRWITDYPHNKYLCSILSLPGLYILWKGAYIYFFTNKKDI